jgi:hypothetical protein
VLFVQRRGSLPRKTLFSAVTAVVVVAAALLVIPASRSSLRDNLDEGFHERLLLWDAAVDMARDEPLLGQGLGGYGVEFGRFRPAEHADEYRDFLADSPHSVPLRMLSEGGALLFLAYLAFGALITVELVRAFRRRGFDLLTAAVGGAWIAYQVQSVVSFDVPALASLHWLLAGWIVLLSRGADDDEPVATPRRRWRARPEPQWQAVAAAAIAVVVAAIPASIPLRADIAVENADELLQTGSVVDAEVQLTDATDLAPWEGSYWGHLVAVRQQIGDREGALEIGIRAAEENPGATNYAFGVVKLASLVNRDGLAERWIDIALHRDRHNAIAWGTAAQWYFDHGRPRVGLEHLERAAALRPSLFGPIVRRLERDVDDQEARSRLFGIVS